MKKKSENGTYFHRNSEVNTEKISFYHRGGQETKNQKQKYFKSGNGPNFVSNNFLFWPPIKDDPYISSI